MSIGHALPARLLVPLLVSGSAVFAQNLPPASSPSPPAPGARPELAVVDPAATVPAVLYRSVFVDTPAGVEMQEVDWKKANADVGQFKRGHVDILQWENRNQAKP